MTRRTLRLSAATQILLRRLEGAGVGQRSQAGKRPGIRETLRLELEKVLEGPRQKEEG